MLNKELKDLMDIGLIKPTYYYTSDLYINNISSKTFDQEVNFILEALKAIISKMPNIELLDISYVLDDDDDYNPKKYGFSIIIDFYFKSKIDPLKIYDVFHGKANIDLSQEFPDIVNKDYFYNYKGIFDFGALGHIFLESEKPY